MSQDFNVNARIKELCVERKYSYYELAKRSEIPYSTLNTMMLKENQPSLSTIRKICHGLGISLFQFFNTEDAPVALSDMQKECLSIFDILKPEEQALAIAYMKGLSHRL